MGGDWGWDVCTGGMTMRKGMTITWLSRTRMRPCAFSTLASKDSFSELVENMSCKQVIQPASEI